jgi:hypothetical protein
MANRKLGRFYTHLAFGEWDGYEIGNAQQDFLVKVTDRDSNCEAYVFEPSMPGETWSILILQYDGSQSPSPALKTQVERLASQLGAEVKLFFQD